jgi:hypothetical protein
MAMAVFNVHDYGASGRKQDNAQGAIQQAIDACAAAGGGTVYFPPGEYTSGTLHLRNHVRIEIDSGATVYSSKERAHFDKPALFYAEDVQNITLTGRGTVDGQAEYEWRLNDMKDWYIYPHQVLVEKAGQSLRRAFPTANTYGHLVVFIRCEDVHINNLSFLRSPTWTMHLWGCERLYIDGVYIRTSLEAGVWADGIDPDGCKDVHISNCTIETGDDALVFYSSHIYGTPRPCENITVTNCRLTSASSGLKFCDGNENAIRNVTIQNCTITGSNRGIAFMVFDGGILENVLIANVTVECKPYDWFWWGDSDAIHFNCIQRSEIDPNIDKSKEPPVGVIRNVRLRDVFARGTGACIVHGHPQSPLQNITLENVRLALYDSNPTAWRKTGDALTVEHARHFQLKNVEVAWEVSDASAWHSALVVDDAQDLTLESVSARPAQPGETPAIALKDVDGAILRDCRALDGSSTFIRVSGARSREIVLVDNDTRAARTPVQCDASASPDAVSSW